MQSFLQVVYFMIERSLFSISFFEETVQVLPKHLQPFYFSFFLIWCSVSQIYSQADRQSGNQQHFHYIIFPERSVFLVSVFHQYALLLCDYLMPRLCLNLTPPQMWTLYQILTSYPFKLHTRLFLHFDQQMLRQQHINEPKHFKHHEIERINEFATKSSHKRTFLCLLCIYFYLKLYSFKYIPSQSNTSI